MSGAESPWPLRAAVVGAGTMGTGFAQLFARAGIACAVADASAPLTRAAVERAVLTARRYEREGLFAPGAAEAVEANVRAAEGIEEAASDADVVIEAVTEDPEVKRLAYARIESAASGEAIIATNTSAISIRRLSEHLARPSRFLGTHWFNPPVWVPCVEVIAGPQTEAAVVERVMALLRRLGKRPVAVGDRAGFVANRIQFAMFREAAAVVEDGVATAEQVDEVVRASFGFRLPFLGPFAIADMAGLDVYAGAYAALEHEFGPRLSAPDSLVRLVGDGRLGTKALAGYRDHSQEEVDRVAARRDGALHNLSALVDDFDATYV